MCYFDWTFNVQGLDISTRHLTCQRSRPNTKTNARGHDALRSNRHDMLLTVFADRLLCSEHLAHLCSHACNYALAVQFLDYPLILLRSRCMLQSGAVYFRNGKAAAVDTDERELAFLLSHVQTTVSLLDTSNGLQPKLLATGQVALQRPSAQNCSSADHIVRRQNVILCDAEQQPVACVEFYASLQAEGNANALASQQQADTPIFAVADRAPAGAGTGPPAFTECAPFAQSSRQQVQTQSADVPQTTSMAMQLVQQRRLGHASSAGVQPSSNPPNNTLSSTYQSCTKGLQQQPFNIEACKLQPSSKSSAVVLEHKQILEVDQGSAAPGGHSIHHLKVDCREQEGGGHRIPNGGAGKAGKPGSPGCSVTIKSTAQAAALRASQILAGTRSAGAQRKSATAAALKPQRGLASQDPDVWSPPPAKAHKRHNFSHTHSTGSARSNQQVLSPQKTARQQRLKGLKQQQMQHWCNSIDKHQQAHCIHPQQQHIGGDEDSSDDCLELDDISCSLSEMVEDERYSSWRQTCSSGPRGTMTRPASDSQPLNTGVAADKVSQEGEADMQLQMSVQPAVPSDWRCQLPDAVGSSLPQQQHQQHVETGELHPHIHQQKPQQQPLDRSHKVTLGAGSCTTATCSSCPNCAATLSAAAQLLQASQQTAAASAGCMQPTVPGVNSLPASQFTAASRPTQQIVQGGVSAATAVVWELMTLMTLRAVLSQAVSSMAGQLSTAVGQILQQALGGIGQLAVNAATAPGCVPSWPSAIAAQTAAAGGMGGRVNDCVAKQSFALANSEQKLQQAVPEVENQQLTPRQLQEQQEELHRQFAQLEALMVVRDDTTSSSCSSSTASSHSSRHRHHHKHKSSCSSRSSSREGHQRYDSKLLTITSSGAHKEPEYNSRSSSPAAHDESRWAHGNRSISVRSSGQWSEDRREKAAAAAAAAATTAGMIVRLRRTTSERREWPASPLSRATSAAGDKSGVSEPEAVPGSSTAATASRKDTAAGASWNISGHKDVIPPTAAGTVDKAASGTVTTGSGQEVASNKLEAAENAVSASRPANTSNRTAIATKRSSVPVTLPPLSRPMSAESNTNVALNAAAGAGILVDRRKLTLAPVDTSYSDNYEEEDFESPASTVPVSPAQTAVKQAAGPASNSHAGTTAAAAAAAALDLLHKALPAVTVTSPQQSPRGHSKLGFVAPAATVSPAAAGSGMWQRNSMKLDRRGSELPEIPEIPEGTIDAVDSLEYELSDLGSSDGHSPNEAKQQRLHSKAGAVNIGRLSGAAAAGVTRNGSLQRFHVTDTLDTLTDSIMEDLMPPAARSLSRRGSSNVHSMSASGLQEWPMPTPGAGNQGAGPRNMSAILPGNRKRAVLAPIASTSHVITAAPTAGTAASVGTTVGSPGSSLGSPSSSRWQQQQQQQQVAAVSSFVSVASTLDDLLASSDLVMPSAPSKHPENCTPDHVAAAAAPDATAVIMQRQKAAASASRQLSKIASAARRVSNYSDVSFLSDEEEEAAATAGKPPPPKQQGHQVRRTQSGMSFMSSLNGSDVDIDYGAGDESAHESHGRAMTAAAVVGNNAESHKLVNTVPRPQSGPQRAAAEGSGKGEGRRNAADVFYSHVSGTPNRSTGAARIW